MFGNIGASAPMMAGGMSCPVIARALTAAGNLGFRIEPSSNDELDRATERRSERDYAVWPGSTSLGVFLRDCGVILAGDGLPSTPRGPNCSRWTSSSEKSGSLPLGSFDMSLFQRDQDDNHCSFTPFLPSGNVNRRSNADLESKNE
ncbi:hypothetical protein [Bradyrhizobium sp. STM 3562]|uniref:hypothetical protein n=1 Tax=Bradyrhizobium sp. STM 3562 TaxID=578924 RepID=UPI00388F4978